MYGANMSNLFQPTALVGAVAIATGFSTSVSAQDSSNVVNASLETLVVTASRSEEKIENVPASITVIDHKLIEKNPIFNLSDIIQTSPSVYLKQNGGIGQTAEISLRGTNPTHTLILKDGARLNSQNHYGSTYPTYLDLTNVQQVEILNGPASVQYGSDAIGGVVQLITTKPERTGAEFTTIVGENQTYKTIAKADLVTDHGFYAQIDGQRLETDGTRIFDDQSENQKAGYDQKGYNLKAGYDDDRLKTDVSFGLNKGTSYFYNWMSDQNDNKRLFENRSFNSRAQYQFTDQLIFSARHSNFNDEQNVFGSENDYFNTNNIENDLNLKWFITPNQNILVGTTLLDSKFKSKSIENQSQKISSTGYYIQHQYNTDKLHTQAGLRVEDNERFGEHTVGQIATRYQLTPATSIYANIGTAFRAPALSELYYYYVDGYYDTFGNPNLKPEESISYEIGAEQGFGRYVVGSISAYQTDIKNLITPEYIASSQYTTYTNTDKAVIQGIELQFKWKYQDLFLTTSYAYTDAKNEKDDKNIAYRPKQTLGLSTGLENNLYGISASLLARSDLYTNTNNSKKAPGYATVNLNMYWNVNPNIKLFSNIQNIGDVNYKIADNFNGGWYVDGGRLASAGVTFRY